MTATQIFALIAAVSMLLSLIIDPLCDVCTYIYHKVCDVFGVCWHPYGKKIRHEEEYLDADSNKTDYAHSVVHHTYKIYYCPKCNKIFNTEQLQ